MPISHSERGQSTLRVEGAGAVDNLRLPLDQGFEKEGGQGTDLSAARSKARRAASRIWGSAGKESRVFLV